MDKYEFFSYEDAMKKINLAQQPFLNKNQRTSNLKKIN